VREQQRERGVGVVEKKGVRKRKGESTDINFCSWQLAPLTEASYHNTHSKRRD
jgi:hypothetical protein